MLQTTNQFWLRDLGWKIQTFRKDDDQEARNRWIPIHVKWNGLFEKRGQRRAIFFGGTIFIYFVSIYKFQYCKIWGSCWLMGLTGLWVCHRTKCWCFVVGYMALPQNAGISYVIPCKYVYTM